MNGNVVSRRQEGVVINRKSTVDNESASGIVTEEFRFTQGKAKQSLSVSGLILLTIELAITIVQTKVIPMANFVSSMMPVKMVRGLFLDGLFAMMFYLPLAITKTILVQLGLDKTIANWLGIESNVVIVASNEEVQKEMERMRNYIRDVNDVNTRLTAQKDFLNADLARKVQQLEKENKQMKDHLNDLDQTCRSLHSQLATSKNENATLRNRINETESTLKKTEANLFNAQEENRANQRALKEMELVQKKMKDATEGWNQASSELNKMRNDAARREEVIKATADELLVVRRDVESLQINAQREAMKMMEVMEQRNAMDKAVKEKDQQIQEMHKTLEQMQQQKAMWESEMQQMKERTGRSENETRRVVEDIRVAQSQREEVQHKAQAVYQERDQLRRELNDTHQQLNRTRQELELMRGNMEHEMGELRQELEQVRGKTVTEVRTIQQQVQK
ncbi:hypothetical protein RvY_04649-1 [Ramazzottius varieornatus]|uniref:Uncharacterized protein n=1 Tax=Ramazzottius varieornatus TaxID=947166 RepID=A0A1D1V298_RAMVA|nr:hypothetical protein RvY_04649-1 [Ramazzottius varieornatus]